MSKKNNEEINIKELPWKPKWYLKPIVFLAATALTCTKKIHVKKENCENLKWPYLIIASHAQELDFAMNAKITFPHATSYICSIEEFVGREGLLRRIGAFPKRKYTKDVRIVKNILTAIKKQNNSVTIYPEARYSLIGCNERIDTAMGKLAKVANVPVVVMICHGNFLNCPQWNKKPARKTRFEVEFKCIATKEDVEKLSAEELQKRIEDNFVFDDYKWQFDNKIKINSKYRAHNIHRVLYKCPHCGKDYAMDSKYTKLWCKECGKEYEMDEYGQIHCLNGESKFVHVPDWYNWERKEVIKEVKEGTYHFEDKVRIEKLTNSHAGFKTIGYVDFKHDLDGLHLHGKLDNGESFDFDNEPINTPSIHIEYDFKKKGVLKQGQAIDINTMKDTWFIYPQTTNTCLTKIHFAVEALYDKASGKLD